MRYTFFYLRLLFFDPWPLLAILKTLLSFLNLVQYIFTYVFKCCFHACYFFYPWLQYFRRESDPILKGAVCRILTLLKHKNTIICLQTFRKHVKLTYLFIWKTMLQSVILLWKCAVRPGMSVFVMVCETRPLPVYPIVFRHPGLPVAGKHSVFN